MVMHPDNNIPNEVDKIKASDDDEERWINEAAENAAINSSSVVS
jgi:hypothetical protein